MGWPIGYVKDEAEFCKEATLEFENNRTDSNRLKVLSKRQEFARQYISKRERLILNIKDLLDEECQSS